MVNFIGIIPARYASTRFPGKPLADISGKSMIQRVYERASEVLDTVLVATDDKKIFEHVVQFNGKVVMTSNEHRSGTDRCAEALKNYTENSSESFDVVINIQGDEPFIRPNQIELLKNCFDREETQIATLIRPIEEQEVLFDQNRPKVVTDINGYALYFSRSTVPFARDIDEQSWLKTHTYFQHIGIYAYRENTLAEITKLQPGLLEKTESLEQLRWLENGYKIMTAQTQFDTFGIDTPDDLERAKQLGLFR